LSEDAVDLGEGDLLARAVAPRLARDAGAPAARGRVGPRARQVEPEPDAHGHLAASQRERDERLAVGRLARLAGVLARHADRVPPLLEQRGVVDDQHGVRAADEPRGLANERGLEGRRIPPGGADEVMELLRVRGRQARGARRDALALARSEQTFEVDRRPAAARFVTERGEKRREPTPELSLPSRTAAGHHGATPYRLRCPARRKNHALVRKWQSSVSLQVQTKKARYAAKPRERQQPPNRVTR
jgi:hypothetical protein